MSTVSATILPLAYTQFFTASGAPNTYGYVYFYAPGTSTPQSTWADPYQQTLNSNPVQLNAAGQALIYGVGQYRQVVYDNNANQIWDGLTEDNGGAATILTTQGTSVQAQLNALNATAPLLLGSSNTGGTPNAITLASTGYVLQAGGLITFYVATTCAAGGVTLQINGGTAYKVYKALQTPLGAGDLVGGYYATVQFTGADFLLAAPAVATGQAPNLTTSGALTLNLGQLPGGVLYFAGASATSVATFSDVVPGRTYVIYDGTGNLSFTAGTTGSVTVVLNATYSGTVGGIYQLVTLNNLSGGTTVFVYQLAVSNGGMPVGYPASTAQVAAATATNVAVTPAGAVWAPSAVTAWAAVGSSGALTFTPSFNVSNVAYVSTTTSYTVTFNNASGGRPATANYAVLATFPTAAVPVSGALTYTVTGATATGFSITIYSASTAEGGQPFNFMVVGG